MKKIIRVIGLLGVISGCSLVETVGVSTVGGIMFKATPAMEQESDLDSLKEGIVSNLQFVESLLYLDPENKDLLATLIKGHAGHGFAIHESDYLADQLADNGNETYKFKALHSYAKAIDYGLRYLKIHNILYENLTEAAKKNAGIEELLNMELSNNQRNREAILFAAQSMAAVINLSKDQMTIVAQLPIAKGMFDWVCKKDPTISFGACQIFYGGYEAGRPAMMGGNPEKGKQIFLKLIRSYPNNWLARVTFLQFYVIPMMDEELYKEQKLALNKFEKLHQANRLWRPDRKKHKVFSESRLRLYQAMAIKRFRAIKKYEKEIF